MKPKTASDHWNLFRRLLSGWFIYQAMKIAPKGSVEELICAVALNQVSSQTLKEVKEETISNG